MPEKYTYLLVDFLCILFPFVFSFHPKINFYKKWRYFFPSCFLTALIFIIWDILFVEKGVWRFNPEYVTGIYLKGLPVEEYLFFICIPYACVFTFHCIDTFFTLSNHSRAIKFLSALLITFLTAVALFNILRLYTSVTFIFLAFILLFLLLTKASFLFPFYLSFLIILIPFFISNGILTGSIIANPVVIYNNNYNLGIRLFTIPFEDIFYGMLLFLLNVTGYTYLKNREP